jgi:hypothetical protein
MVRDGVGLIGVELKIGLGRGEFFGGNVKLAQDFVLFLGGSGKGRARGEQKQRHRSGKNELFSQMHRFPSAANRSRSLTG